MTTDDAQRTTRIYQHYVYTLAYPDGRMFYVGKGWAIGSTPMSKRREAVYSLRSVQSFVAYGSREAKLSRRRWPTLPAMQRLHDTSDSS